MRRQLVMRTRPDSCSSVSNETARISSHYLSQLALHGPTRPHLERLFTTIVFPRDDIIRAGSSHTWPVPDASGSECEKWKVSILNRLSVDLAPTGPPLVHRNEILHFHTTREVSGEHKTTLKCSAIEVTQGPRRDPNVACGCLATKWAVDAAS